MAVYKRGRGFEHGTTGSKSSSHYSCLRAQTQGKKKAQPASGRLDYFRNTLALIQVRLINTNAGTIFEF